MDLENAKLLQQHLSYQIPEEERVFLEWKNLNFYVPKPKPLFWGRNRLDGVSFKDNTHESSFHALDKQELLLDKVPQESSYGITADKISQLDDEIKGMN